MESEMINFFTTQGAWAVLFVWLLFYTIKENKSRESEMRLDMAKRDTVAQEREKVLNETIDKNQSIIQDLASKFNVVEDIKDDMNFMKVDITDIKNKLQK